MECYFEGESGYDAYFISHTIPKITYSLDDEKIPKEYQIKFICNNDKKPHVRNVFDLFEGIWNTIRNNKKYDIDGNVYDYYNIVAKDIYLNNFKYNSEQVEIIRNKRKLALCNDIIKKIIKGYGGIQYSNLVKHIEINNINCNQAILAAIYCNVNKDNQNKFILDLLENCQKIDENLLLFAVEENLDEVVVNELIRLNKNYMNLINERGETVIDIIQRTKNNKEYHIEKNPNYVPLFIKSICNVDMPMVRKLIINGADINMRFNEQEFTPLMMAARIGSEQVVQLLLDNNADPLLETINEQTAYDLTDNDDIKKLLQT
jgi:hypothetical protein